MRRLHFSLPLSGLDDGLWSQIAEVMHKQGAEMEATAKGMKREEIADVLNECTSRRFFELETAKLVVAHFDGYCSERTGLKFGLEFIKLIAGLPVASVGSDTIDQLFRHSAADEHCKLLEWLAANDQPSSVKRWMKPAENWNGTLVQTFICSQTMTEEEFSGFEEELFYLFDEADWYQVWEASVDWKRYEKKVAQKTVLGIGVRKEVAHVN